MGTERVPACLARMERFERACLVVNAGEGAGEFFTVSCRHESCQDRTMLDMVGKMVTDGWFEREELDSEHYNALAPEDAPDAEAEASIRAGRRPISVSAGR